MFSHPTNVPKLQHFSMSVIRPIDMRHIISWVGKDCPQVESLYLDFWLGDHTCSYSFPREVPTFGRMRQLYMLMEFNELFDVTQVAALMTGCPLLLRLHLVEMKDDDDYTGKDLISAMPNDILCSILSRMDTKDVVRTSILCRRWSNLYLFLPYYSFSCRCSFEIPFFGQCSCTAENKKKFLTVLDRFFRIPRGAGCEKIKSFSLSSLDGVWKSLHSGCVVNRIQNKSHFRFRSFYAKQQQHRCSNLCIWSHASWNGGTLQSPTAFQVSNIPKIGLYRIS
ncbi:unnamed protein product [Cuscuta epithymum]|uniref:F-box domain-containing protein n=1 Tax=Cuscuta epithymum TaxID=186058 RepID=A0AAV0EYN6_9ASTE|nr:unnamed protein product [Cuscuta epithymum]